MYFFNAIDFICVIFVYGFIDTRNTVGQEEVSFGSVPEQSVSLRDPHPIGLSFEFYEFSAYVKSVPPTTQCIQNLEEALGSKIAFRIGGTTQDRASYDPQLDKAVKLQFSANDKRVPEKLQYGKEFIKLASALNGPTTIGLNRFSGDIENAFLASQEILKTMKNLESISLGNEPEFWKTRGPISRGKEWTPETDSFSQAEWQHNLTQRLQFNDLFQLGEYLQLPKWGVENLIKINNPALDATKTGHAFPQSACGKSRTDLKSLMSHKSTVEFARKYRTEAAAAHKFGKNFYISETNSATCGGGAISPMFGSGLWVLNFIMQSLLNGVSRIYFHHGTIGDSPYSFWGKRNIAAPYYGAYFAALALKEIDGVMMLDDGTTQHAVYLLTGSSIPKRLLLYNSELKSRQAGNMGSKANYKINLSGAAIFDHKAKVIRLSADQATSRSDRKATPNINGLQFSEDTCKKLEKSNNEGERGTTEIVGGVINIEVAASQAVIIELNPKK
ncbi:family 79 glycoside hydrolase [Phakopsora pachyrhizi]|uniref:Family 79 glycoside hydrolase n=1 Tax=Phakopsora pachyrhizi TaxID=170000 RepID=A0AAV0ALD7_PHAPC|nr:family 79 glycoside hydrolase [Phakopsora pachyrhizi]CAH7676994.1 family 79 glycoside hydrolase [Phakopsora pachyrhizi]